MSANVGLSTPRGSGTSGYVQRNLSHLKPRDRDAPYSVEEIKEHKQRKPDPGILEHERKRRIEVKIMELRDQLEDEGIDEDEIDERADKLREKLEAEDKAGVHKKIDRRDLKDYQVHDLAKAKIEETEKFRRALGIKKDFQGANYDKKKTAEPEPET